ncbi:DNA-binding transcriptional dual regulator Crp [Prochlorococcus marinus str. MIT 1313]|uniref:cyclic nucleotide-binding domain-containing protein n=1 Tax=Prochlorococcus TaxID=1218 RepID=UPI0007B3E416|nr:cyclic nucleotide-binding domain-containing protein [Prochlorococcus marinus]KZR70181.1 DNA-binding transcriptional dual regulator Crp [Prochlorococcus marinus str. MIT 1313]KZR72905.1 DNA-binding transcriptional dual regulator Crp [Prochlorococcus marinus str. MIT 1318]
MEFNFFLIAEEKLIEWVASNSTVVSAKQSLTLIREGDYCKEFYILRHGHLFVTTSRRSEDGVLLAKLSEGALVGEMSFLESRPPVATVVAEAGSEILAVNKDTLSSAIKNDSSLGRALYHLLAQKLSQQIQQQNAMVHKFSGNVVEPLRKVLTLFSDLSESDVIWISNKGQLYRLKPEQALIRQGETLPEIFLILAGDASVSVQLDDKEKIVGSSTRGELLGEMSMVNSQYNLTTATVRAASGMETIGIDKAALKDKIQSNAGFGMRFYRGMSRMLSQRGRDQLASMGLAYRSQEKETDGKVTSSDDSIDFDILSGITTAGSRFDWLCKQFQNKTATNLQ